MNKCFDKGSAISIGVVLFITACGGGAGDEESEASSPPPTASPPPASNSGGSIGSNTSTSFINWSNSANGTTVLDSNNDGFAVDIVSTRLVSLQANLFLSGSSVSGSTVSLNGTPIGFVGNGTATNGSNIAVLKCSDGRSMDISLDGRGWIYSCGDSTSQNPGSNQSPSSPDGVTASNCLSLERNPNDPSRNSLYFFNHCSVRVYYNYCVTNNGGFTCGTTRSSGGMIYYGKGSDSVPPGNYSFISGASAGESVYWFACAAGPSGRQPIPFLTSLNPPTGACK